MMSCYTSCRIDLQLITAYLKQITIPPKCDNKWHICIAELLNPIHILVTAILMTKCFQELISAVVKFTITGEKTLEINISASWHIFSISVKW